MSLHALANHLQSAGRGDDKVLIHMTPKEVSGLQALAMAHGGSLTINPETGLPEAGFLDRLLPTIIGAGLTIASGGALSPLMAAGITGAGYGIAKGSLQEGLMAGLGAYGGAGLASGLNAAGAAAAPSANIGANANTVVSSGTAADAANKLSNYAPNVGANVGATGGVQAANLSQPIVAKPFASGFQDAGAVMRSGLATTPQATQVALQAPPVAPAAIQEVAKTVPNVTPSYFDNVKAGFGEATGSFKGLQNVWDKTPTGTGYGLLATGMGIMQDSRNKGTGAPKPSDSYIRPYDYSVAQDPNAYVPSASTAERKYFTEPRFTARPIERVAKEGGLMALSKYGIGGEVEQMSAENSVSGNTMYPQSQLQTAMYSNPMVQRPVQNDVITAGLDTPTQPYSGEMRMASGGKLSLRQMQQQGAFSNSAPSSYTAPTPSAAYTPEGQAMGAPDTSMVPNIQLQPLQSPEQQLGLESFYANMNQRLAEQGGYAAGGMAGGVSHLGDYSDGGRLLKGPGDGVSDSIPASIGNRQPARLADGEFVVPARIVSEIGNGSTEAGARKLYAMMDRVQKARRKTVGKNKVAVNSKADKFLPA